jgi:hypothetical protein
VFAPRIPTIAGRVLPQIYELLSHIEPVLVGPWRWALYAAIAAGLVTALWTAIGRRWRSDGVRRCPKCAHTVDPTARIDPVAGLRCSECGTVAHRERELLRMHGRRRTAAAGIAVALLLATPLFFWHNGPIFVARTLLPRWWTLESARMPDGLLLVHQVDPVQWMELEPNSAASAAKGGFEDTLPQPAGSNAPPTLVYPERERLLLGLHDGTPEPLPLHGPFAFGLDGRDGRMPAVGTPGFGGDIDGDGAPDLIVGQVNVGSGGGTWWSRLVPAETPDARVLTCGPGRGYFARADDGAILFHWIVPGFRYTLVPGAFLADPDVPCEPDPATHAWKPAAARMRRMVDRAAIAQATREVKEAYERCGAAPSSGTQVNLAGTASVLQRCPEMIAPLARIVVEMVFTGNEAQWEEFVRIAWPGDPGDRDAFLYEMRRAIESCDARPFLRTLNGIPEPVPAVGSTPVRSTLRERSKGATP